MPLSPVWQTMGWGCMCRDFPEGGSGRAECHQVAAWRRGSPEGAKGCSDRARESQHHPFHSVSWAGGKFKRDDKILFTHLPCCFLQSWGTKGMPPGFKVLLLFVRLGGNHKASKKRPTVGKILTSELTHIVTQGALASVL